MSMSETTDVCINLFLTLFIIFLFFYYFDIFFPRRGDIFLTIIGLGVFFTWEFFIVCIIKVIPTYINIFVTIGITFFSSSAVYKGGFWNKCFFSIAFDAIWMLLETLSNYLLIIYCEVYASSQPFGSFVSKILFLIVIFALKKVFTNDEIKELPMRYSIMLVLIPTGSIYIMNNIFMLGYRVNSTREKLYSALAVLLLLSMNVLIFYIYYKLADNLLLRRMTAVYEQQLELCERHQDERELSMLQMRETKHNMRNDFVTILAYAEKGECKKIIDFINEVLDESGIKISTVVNTGNIVIDSLIGYWYVVAKQNNILFNIEVSIPMLLPFKGADLSLVLGNILENAVEAASKVDGDKYIRIRMKYDKNNLLIYLVNNYAGKLIKTKDKKLKSTKKDSGNHGIGLSSAERVVAKYHGTLAIDDSVEQRFLIRIVLYGNPE